MKTHLNCWWIGQWVVYFSIAIYFYCIFLTDHHCFIFIFISSVNCSWTLLKTFFNMKLHLRKIFSKVWLTWFAAVARIVTVATFGIFMFHFGWRCFNFELYSHNSFSEVWLTWFAWLGAHSNCRSWLWRLAAGDPTDPGRKGELRSEKKLRRKTRKKNKRKSSCSRGSAGLRKEKRGGEETSCLRKKQ